MIPMPSLKAGGGFVFGNAPFHGQGFCQAQTA